MIYDGDLSDQDQLANFRAVTDTKLGRLDVENLLIELLERVRGILDADTAAVLLSTRTRVISSPGRRVVLRRRSAKASGYLLASALPDA